MLHPRPGESGRAPRHEVPSSRWIPTPAYPFVRDELMLDGNARLNLATFVSTWMEPQAQRLMAEMLEGASGARYSQVGAGMRRG